MIHFFFNYKDFFLGFFTAKVSISGSKFNDDVTSISIVNKDKLSKHSCVILDLRRVLIHFNTEKE